MMGASWPPPRLGIQPGRLGGKPANSVLCEYCGYGIVVAASRDDAWGAGWEVRTAHIRADSLSYTHRISITEEAVVSILPMPREDVPAAADHIGSLIGLFLNAFRELHLTCQGDTRDVDET